MTVKQSIGSFLKISNCLGTDNPLNHTMAETDPKSVQDLTNVVSRDRDGELALTLAAVA